MKPLGENKDQAMQLLEQMLSRLGGFGPGALRMGALERVMGELTAEGFTLRDLAREALQPSPGFLSRLNEAITVGETYFFRQPDHFKALIGDVLPALRGQKVKAWSAGCATGEEAYSLSASLEAFGFQDPSFDFEILATDLSDKHLRAARKGLYGPWSSREEELYPVFPAKAPSGPRSVRPELKEKVRFLQHNLLHPLPGGEGPFHFIFCRNVLVYFTPEAAHLALRHLGGALGPGGLLFLGPADIPFDPPGFQLRDRSGLSIYEKKSAARIKASGKKKLSRKVIPPTFPVAKARPAGPSRPPAELPQDIALHLEVLEQMEGDNQVEVERRLKQLLRRFPGYLPGLYEAALWSARSQRREAAEELMNEILERLTGRDSQENIPGPQELTTDFYRVSARTFLEQGTHP